MSVIQIDVDLLRSIVKDSVAEAIQKEITTFYERIVPFVSNEEMQDIIKTHGEKPKISQFVDMTSWFENE